MLNFYVTATTNSTKDPITAFEGIFSTFEDSAINELLFELIN